MLLYFGKFIIFLDSSLVFTNEESENLTGTQKKQMLTSNKMFTALSHKSSWTR